MNILPYITFNGNCREAFEFYKTVFGREFTHISTFGNMPSNDDCPVSKEEADNIMQPLLPNGGETVLWAVILQKQWVKQAELATTFQFCSTNEIMD